MPKIVDLTGQRFGKLSVIGLAGNVGKGSLCRVLCDCGEEKTILQTKLTRTTKPSRSCGCGVQENHLNSHNMTHHEFYPIWRAMTGRCFNPSNGAYKNYGGRGISISKEWANDPVDFIAWLESSHYKKGLQIDRIDNDGDYSPENCHIVTCSENARNRRSTRYITLDGIKRHFIDVAEEFGIKYGTLYRRIFISGMTPEAAVIYQRKVVCQK